MKNRYREEETFGYYNRGEILIKFDHHLDFMIEPNQTDFNETFDGVSFNGFENAILINR